MSVQSWLLAASIALSATAADAANGVFLPAAPQGPGGEDSIETSSGTRCRQSMNSNGAYVDVGAVGSAASPPPDRSLGFTGETREREALAYARLTVPIGKRPRRIDCNAIYELEIARLKREVEMLRMAAE